MTDLPIACSLDGAALARRQAELAAGLLAEAVNVDPLPDGFRWRFVSTPGLIARIAAVIEGERQCCRFLRFALDADPDMGHVTLTVTGPEGARDFLEAWLPGARANEEAAGPAR